MSTGSQKGKKICEAPICK